MCVHVCIVLDVGLFRAPGGQFLPNNSIVAVSDIRVDLGGIFCLTDQVDCCESTTEARWLSPDGTAADSIPSVSVSRGPSFLSLNREADAEIGDGLFHCEVPNAEGEIEELYIGLFSDSSAGITCSNPCINASNQLFIHA